MKLKHLLALAGFIVGGGSNLWAQTWEDVSSFLLKNSDFEGSYTAQKTFSSGTNDERSIFAPNGWTVVHSNENSNDITVLKNGDKQSASFKYFDFHPSDGDDQAFLVRFRWGGYYWSNGQKGNLDKISLTQATTLPTGKYRLSAETVFITAEPDATGYLRIYADKTTGGSLGWKDAEKTNGENNGEVIKSGSASWITTSTDEWNLDEATGVTFGIEFQQTWRWEIQAGIDNYKLEHYFEAGESMSVPATAGNWTLNTGKYPSDYVEHYVNGQPKGEYLRYTINKVPRGTYDVKLTVKSSSTSSRDANCASVIDGDTKYTSIVAGDVSLDIPSYNALDDKTGAEPVQYTLTGISVSDGALVVSININEVGPNWIIAKIDEITYHSVNPYKQAFEDALAVAKSTISNESYNNVMGTERGDLQALINATEPTTNEGYTSATNALTEKTFAFTAAKTNYDDLIREIEKATALGIDASSYAPTSTTTAETALTSTQNLKVTEYNYVTNTYQYGVDLGEWISTATNTKAADFSNEHWSGTKHSYKNQDDSNGQGWNANSWEINFSQDVTLPAGNYVFKVAGRQASGNAVTTSLIVKLGDTELGSVNDFPRSNKALGINKDGVTSFNSDDEAGFANNGNGYGWEWRYVKFTLTESATVNIAIHSDATAKYQWVSFGDYTVQTDNEANISLIAYNIALNDAKTAKNNEDYANVKGDELTALNEAIAADETLDKTNKADIEAATSTLTEATAAFTAAKSAYDTFVAAKGKKYENDLAYASATKFADIATAQAAADATSAEDATSKTNAILSAYRKYVESHALAEGVKDAEQIIIPEANFDGLTTSSEGYDPNNWKISENWFLDGQNNGAISFNTTNTVIDGDGNSNYNYIRIQKNDNNAGIHQAINLLPGKYMMTAAVRCQSGQGAKFEAFAGDVWVDAPQADNVGGTFDHGWNDVNVEFSVYETKEITFGVKSNYGRNIWWNATRFRLVKLADIEEVTIDEASENAPEATTDPVNVTLTRTLSKDYWNTFCSPVAITADEIKAKFGEDTKVREMDTDADVVDNVIPFKDATAIEAGKPYLVKPAQTVTNPTFAGKTVVNEAKTIKNGDYKYIGILAKTHLDAPATEATALDLYLSTDGTMKKPGTNGANLKGMRAYFNVPVAAAEIGVKLFLGEDVDAITVIDGEPVAGAAIYNLAGQRIAAPQKGVNIIGGKKVLVK